MPIRSGSTRATARWAAEAKIFHAFHAPVGVDASRTRRCGRAFDAGSIKITIGRSDLLPIEFLEAGRTAAAASPRSSSRIVDGVAETTLAGNPAMGTAFTGGALVLTNHHVINNRAPGQMAASYIASEGLPSRWRRRRDHDGTASTVPHGPGSGGQKNGTARRTAP